MARIAKKYIKYGTGSDESNAQDIPANFTPSNYTPTQVASEGTDKISAHLKGIDAAITGGGGGGSFFDIQDVSSNITAASGKTYLVDTTVARTITLPASPSTNDYFVVKDKSGSVNTNNITIARAATETIENVGANYTIDSNYSSTTFVADASGNWWIV